MRIRDWSSDVCSSDLSAPCEARNRKEAAFVRGHNRLKAASMTDSDMSRPLLRILIAAPRGFCARVDRAIHIVERAIEKYGAPVYVRHAIVHNKSVVDSLKAKGAGFGEELDMRSEGRRGGKGSVRA